MFKKIFLVGMLAVVGITVGICVNSALSKNDTEGQGIANASYSIVVAQKDGLKLFYYAMKVSDSKERIIIEKFWAGGAEGWQYIDGELPLYKDNYKSVSVLKR